MTDLTTMHLKCLLEKATPGPWEYVTGDTPDGRYIGNTDSMAMCIGVEANGEGSSCGDADLNLAAAAPELAREVLQMRSELESMRRAWLLMTGDPERTPTEQNFAAHVVDHINTILRNHDE